MNLTTFTNFTKTILSLALLVSLAGCGSEDADKSWLPPPMADIGLTAEQEAKIKPIALEARKQVTAVREDARLDSAAKEEKLRPIGKAISDQYKAILTPQQWTNFLAAREARGLKNKPATPTAKKEP